MLRYDRVPTWVAFALLCLGAQDGSTPLLGACQGSALGIVKYLLERGANINHANEEVCFV